MPTLTPIVDSVIPRAVEKPIPVRTVTTRSVPRPAPAAPAEANGDQATTLREKVVGEESPAAADSVRLSPQLTALARKEQAYRQRELALKQREKDVEARLADADKFAQLKAKVAAKDYSEAEALGLSYEDYTKYLLEKQSGEKPEDLRFKTVEEKLAALEKSQEETATAQYEATVAEYRTEISKFAETNPEYAGFKDPELQAGVLQSILDTFEKDDIEMPLEEAFKLAKAVLQDKAKQLAAFREAEKVETAEEKRPLPPPAKSGLKTLTQQVNAGANTAPLKSLQHMPDNERYAEARRRAEAKLRAQQGQ